MSHWQKNRYIQYYNLDYEKCEVIQNGISPMLNNYVLTKTPSTKTLSLIYISSAYRGMNNLIPLFNPLLNFFPNLKLKIFSGFSIENSADNQYSPLTMEFLNQKISPPHDIVFKDLYKQFINHKNIDFYGNVPQTVLFKHLKESMILFYPCIFPETCCTSVLESMACRCFIVSSDIGALRETSNNMAYLYDPCIDVNHADIDIGSFCSNPDYMNANDLSSNYKKSFINKTKELLTNYYTEDSQFYLDKQQEYVKNNCLWEHKRKQFDVCINK